jgi:Holliday junction DNA helicase RuvB
MNESHRPICFANVFGQHEAKELLQIKINAYKKNNKNIGHILFLGPPGTGKTTLANVVAREMGVGFHNIMGNKIKTWGDLYNIIKNIETNDIVFIDEIHCLTEKMQEYLYGIMEDFVYTLEDKNLSRPVPMKCNKFTLVGATTHGGLLNGPFLSRFHHIVNLAPYTNSQLKDLVVSSCYRQFGLDIPDNIAATIAKLSNKTPRKANMILSNYLETAEGTIKGKITSSHLTPELLQKTLMIMSVDPVIGFDKAQRNYIYVLVREYTTSNKALGIGPLSTLCKEQKETVENYIEPVLLSDIEAHVPQTGISINGPLVKLTKHGRAATQNAVNYLKIMHQYQKQLNWFPDEKFTF